MEILCEAPKGGTKAAVGMYQDGAKDYPLVALWYRDKEAERITIESFKALMPSIVFPSLLRDGKGFSVFLEQTAKRHWKMKISNHRQDVSGSNAAKQQGLPPVFWEGAWTYEVADDATMLAFSDRVKRHKGAVMAVMTERVIGEASPNSVLYAAWIPDVRLKWGEQRR